MQIEDRPVVKQITTFVREHHPVEKEFVVETRPTGKLLCILQQVHASFSLYMYFYQVSFFCCNRAVNAFVHICSAWHH